METLEPPRDSLASNNSGLCRSPPSQRLANYIHPHAQHVQPMCIHDEASILCKHVACRRRQYAGVAIYAQAGNQIHPPLPRLQYVDPSVPCRMLIYLNCEGGVGSPSCRRACICIAHRVSTASYLPSRPVLMACCRPRRQEGTAAR